MSSMRNVLIAYTKRNPLIGYCQGMNFILGRLVQNLNEEEAFWVYSMLMEQVLPIDYYAQMIGVHADVEYFGEELLKSVLPEVHEHFIDLNFKATFFSFNWFVCLF
jgi:Rab-GTPase-TBC domain